MKVDYLIVGAGFTGSVLAERIAAELGKTVLLVDRRNHVGGNAYDERGSSGHLVHRYGPHIFHTNSAKILEYLSRFTAWQPYAHHVLGVVEGREVPIPFNFDSMDLLFPAALSTKYQNALLDRYAYGERVPILKLRETNDRILNDLAEYVYRNVFENYTKKQWGMLPTDLSPSVTARVPIVVGRDSRYFSDTYQVMPSEGYSALFRRLLDNRRIRVLLNTDFQDIKGEVAASQTIFTGAIDEYYGFRFGPLPYRSLRFEFEVRPVERAQKVGTVNYPNNNTWTRITEMKTLTGDALPGTALCTEYPEAHVSGVNDPYYPIPRDENKALYEKYLSLGEGDARAPIFCGRLADYQYYNMDQAVGRALAVFEKIRLQAR